MPRSNSRGFVGEKSHPINDQSARFLLVCRAIVLIFAGLMQASVDADNPISIY
jgi:hypothetical protein